MKPFSIVACALLAAPALGLAQATPASPLAAADPAAAVTAPSYRSALAQGPRGVAQDSIPWSAANAEVGRNMRGHMDILKWEQTQGAASGATEPPAPPTPRPHSMHRHH